MGYAYILTGIDGKPSGYKECDGEVAYMPKQQSYENIFRLVKIDLNTMVVLNHDFIKDYRYVYRKGILLKGIFAEDFHVFNPVFTGNHQVIYTPYGNAKVAHPESFEVLDEGLPSEGLHFPQSYGRDKEYVYHFDGFTQTSHAVRLRACKNPAAFSILSAGYTKDDKQVYYRNVIIKKANPKTFVVLENEYACDDKHVFRRGTLLEADLTTFEVLKDGYARDHQKQFLNGVIIE